jgi:hypothetical protein
MVHGRRAPDQFLQNRSGARGLLPSGALECVFWPRTRVGGLITPSAFVGGPGALSSLRLPIDSSPSLGPCSSLCVWAKDQDSDPSIKAWDFLSIKAQGLLSTAQQAPCYRPLLRQSHAWGVTLRDKIPPLDSKARGLPGPHVSPQGQAPSPPRKPPEGAPRQGHSKPTA